MDALICIYQIQIINIIEYSYFEKHFKPEYANTAIAPMFARVKINEERNLAP